MRHRCLVTQTDLNVQCGRIGLGWIVIIGHTERYHIGIKCRIGVAGRRSSTTGIKRTVAIEVPLVLDNAMFRMTVPRATGIKADWGVVSRRIRRRIKHGHWFVV